ncbi:MAG: ubiquinol-cytochrome C chaperone family protein [Bradyrhizobium sp.]|jgi:cytochrome b pre-mRNA-processing protein 3|uniref:ubiquinol-cytochrome C chaperone family protein n=1 Tax=Bradyrhizobium sp. TaxID=376 RepID=UPI003C7AE034
MLWPFNHFRKSPKSPRGTIQAIYGMIVAHAREPLFYKHLDVPDTVDGRLDLLILQLWLVLRRLRTVPGGAKLSQALFDHFCSDMDANLREMGVGDLAVPKRMQKFGEAFYGRTAAYDLAWSESETRLAQALQKNILNGTHPESARLLAAHAARVAATLEACDDATLLRAAWRFPVPLEQDLTT